MEAPSLVVKNMNPRMGLPMYQYWYTIYYLGNIELTTYTKFHMEMK